MNQLVISFCPDEGKKTQLKSVPYKKKNYLVYISQYPPLIVSRILRPRPLQAITVRDPTEEHTVTYTSTLTLPYRGPK